MERQSLTVRTLTPGVTAPDTTPLIIPTDAPAPGRTHSTAPLRREGPAKLTGAAKYADDLVFPGAWFGVTVRSTQPHARLLGIHLDDGFDWTRVIVVSADDIPGENVVSLIDDDQPVLVPVGGEIRHQAEPCALIAAPDQATLHAAKQHITLRTERLPAVFDPLKSEQEFAHYTVESGDAAAAMATAELVIEGTYRVGHQEQLYIENQAMIAVPREDGGVTVHGSLQCPYYVHKAMKRALDMGDELAVVVQAETGGGFGGKEEYPSVLAVHASLLALKCHKPVRMMYDRHEDISATTKRHPAVIRYRSGVSATSELVAQEIEVIMDGGAYATLTAVVLSRGTLHAGGPYRCPNVRITGRAMATNTAPNGAFRGFGAPQTEFAAEMQINRIAEALDASPLDLRRRWVYREGDTTPTGQILRESVAGIEVLEAAAEAASFDRTHAQTRSMRDARTDGARTATGIGLALAWHGAGFTGSGEVKLASVASLELTVDGRIRILTASTEMGQGTKTIFPQIVADALGVDYEEVEIAPQDTSIVPDSGPTVASRTAMVVGGLLIKAAEKLRARVESEAGRPFAEAYRDAGPMRIDEQFVPYPGEPFDDRTYRGDAYPAFGWACAVAKVDVDLDTGEVAVRECVSANDMGTVIHPVLAEGQIEGGTLQAIGYATIEEMKLIDGRYLNDRLATYLIPTSLDAPRIRSIFVEKPFSGVPHGAKGIGELPMDVGAPAVVAAIHDAIGIWIHDLPATPERIMAALSGGDMPQAPGVSLREPSPRTPPLEDVPAGGDEMPFRAPTDPGDPR